jgi:hypothetical protein
MSSVGSGTSITAVYQAKPQGSPRNIFQKSFEKSKVQVQKVRPNKITINTPKKGRNMLQITRKKQYLPSSMSPMWHDKGFSSKNSVIYYNRNVIELPGDVGSKSKKIPENS